MDEWENLNKKSDDKTRINDRTTRAKKKKNFSTEGEGMERYICFFFVFALRCTLFHQRHSSDQRRFLAQKWLTRLKNYSESKKIIIIIGQKKNLNINAGGWNKARKKMIKYNISIESMPKCDKRRWRKNPLYSQEFNWFWLIHLVDGGGGCGGILKHVCGHTCIVYVLQIIAIVEIP